MARGLKTTHFKNIYYRPKISINEHGLLLWLREVNIAMTAVFKRGTIPCHTHQESQTGVEQLRYLAPISADMTILLVGTMQPQMTSTLDTAGRS